MLERSPNGRRRRTPVESPRASRRPGICLEGDQLDGTLGGATPLSLADNAVSRFKALVGIKLTVRSSGAAVAIGEYRVEAD